MVFLLFPLQSEARIAKQLIKVENLEGSSCRRKETCTPSFKSMHTEKASRQISKLGNQTKKKFCKEEERGDWSKQTLESVKDAERMRTHSKMLAGCAHETKGSNLLVHQPVH